MRASVSHGKSTPRFHTITPQRVLQTNLLVGCKRFDRIGRCTYTDGMEINLSPELQAKLDRIASQQGRDTESLVHEAVEPLVGYDQWLVRQVESGQVLEHEEVAARMEKLITQKQRRV